VPRTHIQTDEQPLLVLDTDWRRRSGIQIRDRIGRGRCRAEQTHLPIPSPANERVVKGPCRCARDPVGVTTLAPWTM
jgi:hypothetical protein